MSINKLPAAQPTPPRVMEGSGQKDRSDGGRFRTIFWGKIPFLERCIRTCFLDWCTQ